MAGVLFLVTALSGCATAPQSHRLLDAPEMELPPGVELAQTPFFPQSRYQCGPAALATVLAAQGVDVTPDALVDDVYVPALQGSLPEEISAAARARGMLAYPLQPSLPDLLAEVAAGHPVLVFQNLGLRWLPKWHFAVVIGYDLTSGEVVLRSGTTARWRSSLPAFERTWARAEHWALVVLPPGELPASARITRYLQAVHDLEHTAPGANTEAAWLAAVHRWPDRPLGWLTWGNNRYQAGDYPAAVTAFSRAARIEPAQAQAWNNLAYALLKDGCPQQALHAARCAQSLAPGEDSYLDTLQEISRLAGAADAAHCPQTRCAAP